MVNAEEGAVLPDPSVDELLSEACSMLKVPQKGGPLVDVHWREYTRFANQWFYFIRRCARCGECLERSLDGFTRIHLRVSGYSVFMLLPVLESLA